MSYQKAYPNLFRQELKKFKTWKIKPIEVDWINKNIDDEQIGQLYSIIRKHHKEIKREFEPLGAKIPMDIEEALKPIIAKMLKEHYG